MIKNFHDEILEHSNEEVISELLNHDNVRIERIVSYGQTTNKEFWYDQNENEWVMLVSGNAAIEFDDGSKVSLSSGDYIDIKAHVKHRVCYTSEFPPAIWLCVFYK